MNKRAVAALTLFAAGAAGVVFADQLGSDIGRPSRTDMTAQSAGSGLTRAKVSVDPQRARAEDHNPLRSSVRSVPTTPATERCASVAAATSGEDRASFALLPLRPSQPAAPGWQG